MATAIELKRDDRPRVRAGTQGRITEKLGPYLLHEELGRGGMAVVYRAESRKPESLGRIVALKQLISQNEFDVDFDLVRSFIDEARLATRFDHPNIAKTYSLGKVEGKYLIEMEYVDGPTLFQLAQQSEHVGAIPVEVVVQVLIQICDALEHVHDMCDDTGKPLDLIHRDVSLTNIIVSRGGIVKLIDFGIVKGHSSQASTMAGTIKGKLAYVAPEYLVGKLDRRADLFALGVVAHELLAGRRLFSGKNDLDTLTRIREMRISAPSRWRPSVPAELDEITLRALERDPDKRWQTAAEMRAALLALQGAPASSAPIRTWIDWAVDREPPKVSQLLNVIDSLDKSCTVAVEPAFIEAERVAEPVETTETAVLREALENGLPLRMLAMIFLASLLVGLIVGFGFALLTAR
ncbi:MAG: serine/threonine-protein kinase [Kofleriaceae bacterium]